MQAVPHFFKVPRYFVYLPGDLTNLLIEITYSARIFCGIR
jgi:hypothetical protein